MDSVPAAAEIPAAEYRLFVREDSARFFLKHRDEGVYLSPKGVGWFTNGAAQTRDWHEIESVHLAVVHMPKQGPTGTCAISFRDGRSLMVLSSSKWGYSDDERNAEYGRFLTDFHRVIPKSARGSIRFHTNASAGRYLGMKVVLAIAAAFLS